MDDLTDPTPSKDESELAIEGALRPSSLAEFVGQTKVRGQLQLLLDGGELHPALVARCLELVELSERLQSFLRPWRRAPVKAFCLCS